MTEKPHVDITVPVPWAKVPARVRIYSVVAVVALIVVVFAVAAVAIMAT